MKTTVWIGVEINQEIYGRFLESFPRQTADGLELEVIRAADQLIGYGYVVHRLSAEEKLKTSGPDLQVITERIQRAFEDHHAPWKATVHVGSTDGPLIRRV